MKTEDKDDQANGKSNDWTNFSIIAGSIIGFLLLVSIIVAIIVSMRNTK